MGVFSGKRGRFGVEDAWPWQGLMQGLGHVVFSGEAPWKGLVITVGSNVLTPTLLLLKTEPPAPSPTCASV